MPEPLSKPRSCNRHHDCDAADAKALARFEAREAEIQAVKDGGETRYWKLPDSILFWYRRAEHCTDDDCEDCFGK